MWLGVYVCACVCVLWSVFRFFGSFFNFRFFFCQATSKNTGNRNQNSILSLFFLFAKIVCKKTVKKKQMHVFHFKKKNKYTLFRNFFCTSKNLCCQNTKTNKPQFFQIKYDTQRHHKEKQNSNSVVL